MSSTSLWLVDDTFLVLCLCTVQHDKRRLHTRRFRERVGVCDGCVSRREDGARNEMTRECNGPGIGARRCDDECAFTSTFAGFRSSITHDPPFLVTSTNGHAERALCGCLRKKQTRVPATPK